MENNPLPIVESRRSFLGQCAMALAGATMVGCGAILQGCEASTSPPGNNGGGNEDLVLDVSTLDADGKFFRTSQKGPDGKAILIVRSSATEYLALSMECPHERYEVSTPSAGSTTITCPYHGSQFDLSGALKAGPATTSLKKYPTTFDSATKKLTVKLS